MGCRKGPVRVATCPLVKGTLLPQRDCSLSVRKRGIAGALIGSTCARRACVCGSDGCKFRSGCSSKAILTYSLLPVCPAYGELNLGGRRIDPFLGIFLSVTLSCALRRLEGCGSVASFMGGAKCFGSSSLCRSCDPKCVASLRGATLSGTGS